MVIGLEDPVPVQSSLAELVRLSNEHGVGLFVDGATYDDVARDTNLTRRAVTLSKLRKFQQLRRIPIADAAILTGRFGSVTGDNDRSDVRLLAAIDAKAVDFLERLGLYLRAARSGHRVTQSARSICVAPARRICALAMYSFSTCQKMSGTLPLNR